MKILRISDVCNRLGVSRATIWRRQKHSDFPKPISLGGRIVGISEAELDEWIKNRAKSRNHKNCMNS